MPRRLIATAAAALALTTLPPAAPAEAQTPTATRICVANQAAYVIRTRLTFTDAVGMRQTTNWKTLTVGQRDCQVMVGVVRLRIGVEGFDTVVWRDICSFNYEDRAAARSRTVFVLGTIFDHRCEVEG